MTILTAMANLLPHLENEEKFLPLWHGIFRMATASKARRLTGTASRWETDHVRSTHSTLAGHSTLVRHRDGVERCLLTAIANGASPGEVGDLLAGLVADLIVNNAGPVIDLIDTAFELLAIIGWEHTIRVHKTIVGPLVNARGGGEETRRWRHPVDLVCNTTTQVDEELSALMQEGHRHSPPLRQRHSLCDGGAARGDAPSAIIETLKGVLPAQRVAGGAEQGSGLHRRFVDFSSSPRRLSSTTG